MHRSSSRSTHPQQPTPITDDDFLHLLGDIEAFYTMYDPVTPLPGDSSQTPINHSNSDQPPGPTTHAIRLRTLAQRIRRSQPTRPQIDLREYRLPYTPFFPHTEFPPYTPTPIDQLPLYMQPEDQENVPPPPTRRSRPSKRQRRNRKHLNST